MREGSRALARTPQNTVQDVEEKGEKVIGGLLPARFVFGTSGAGDFRE
jgi:hypothetical protein